MPRSIRSLLPLTLVTLALALLAACSTDAIPTGLQPAANAPSADWIVISPIQRLGPEDFVEIVAGDHHTCARKLNQNVYCWGKNNLVQTGVITGSTCYGYPCVNRPTLVKTPKVGGDSILRAIQIDAGTDHTCMRDPNGSAWCWGDGSQGQLGSWPSAQGTPGEPSRVYGKRVYSSIGAGGTSTCATSTTGMYCWGRLAQNASVPTLLSSYNGYSTVSVGELHACTMQIVDSYRVVDCWGDNHYGQIGIDQASMAYGPFTVRAQFGESVSRVSTQRNVTCVDQTSGIVQCVGDNSFREIGLPSSVWGSGIPQTIGGGQQLHGVSASVFHVCALDAGNGAWCWGMGFFGQLGNGQNPSSQQTPVQVTGGRAYRAIATGYQHTCAIGTDNHIYCWGYNDFGQLGAGILNSWISNPVQALDP
jgi:alpha-tubulin suppressor-like RCC1 family protein